MSTSNDPSSAARAPDGSPHPVSMRVVDVYPYRLREGAPELLVLRRADAASYAGSWRMVGGKIKPDETAWQAALRELREETALVPTRCWAVPSVNAFYEWQHDRINLIPAFAAAVTGVPVLNHEHDAFAWHPADAAAERFAWPEQQRLARLVATLLRRGVPPALEVPVEA